MPPAPGGPPGKRGPNRQLLTTLRIPTHISALRQDDSPRRIPTVIWRTCLIIAGLVALNAALAVVILTAVRGFRGCDAARAQAVSTAVICTAVSSLDCIRVPDEGW